MRNIDFFNFLPEEVEVLRLRYTRPGRSIREVSEITLWGRDIVKRNETLALLKLKNGLHNCGIVVDNCGIRTALLKGIIKLTGIVENNMRSQAEME